MGGGGVLAIPKQKNKFYRRVTQFRGGRGGGSTKVSGSSNSKAIEIQLCFSKRCLGFRVCFLWLVCSFMFRV